MRSVAGVKPLDQTQPQNPATADVAGLVWDIRDLTAAQDQHISDKVRALKQD
ncbi:hypothetical protein AB0M38_11035 [Streptomyces sp. NPDC051742]|uniref:hypothetical protein n=1 Tax=unclassified Streptomyces TaxID=2593676 RepID=UPI003430EEBF